MAGDTSPTMCEAHPGQAVTGTCAGCGKPVCRECAKQFGYYCSAACLEKGRRTVTEQVRERARRNEAALRRSTRLGRLLLWLLLGLFVLAALAIAWRFFLDPAGKVCWQWNGAQASGPATVIGADAAGVTVVSGSTVVVLDAVSGRETRSFALPGQGPGAGGAPAGDTGDEDDDDVRYAFAGFSGQFRVLEDGSLLREKRDGLCRITTAGQTAFEQTYEEGSIANLVIAPDAMRAVYVVTVPADLAVAKKARAALRQAEAELEKAIEAAGGNDAVGGEETEKTKAFYKRIQAAHSVLAQTRTGIVCLDLTTGKEAWASPKMKKGVSVNALSADASTVRAVFMSPSGEGGEAGGVSWGIVALSLADGSRRWQAALPDAPNWGPEVCGDLTLVHTGKELKAFKPDGSDAWTLKLPEKAGLRPVWREGVLLLLGESGCRCLDPATGKEKWGVVLGLSERGVVVGGKRVYLAGEVEESLADKDMKLPPAYKELDNMPELKGIMEQARKRIVPMVVALDRESGQELWRLRNAYGQPLGDDRRFVLVADTAQTSLLEAATGGKGVTLIRQINPKNGKQMYSRQSTLGFDEPVLIGKRVVGLAYERSERPSVFNPGAGLDSAGPKPLGVAAYRVK